MAGNSSNHPLLIVENNIVKVYTKHTNKYAVNAFVEEIICNENDVHPSIFGAAFQWQRDGTALFYDGNVGIGTVTPDAKLAVNGIIHSKEVKVDLERWPDYVFKKEYDLPALQEVEKYISEKGHLQNISSEEEVLKNGLNLGEINSKLLQKIEEPTLYAIEQEKKTEKLSNYISELNILILEQNKRLEKLEK